MRAGLLSGGHSRTFCQRFIPPRMRLGRTTPPAAAKVVRPPRRDSRLEGQTGTRTLSARAVIEHGVYAAGFHLVVEVFDDLLAAGEKAVDFHVRE